jgi:hypothetical protein
MSSSDTDPRLLTGRFNSPVSDPSTYVSGGEILIGKLVSTLLGALWLTIAAGWITVARAIVQIHVSLLNRAAEMYSQILLAFGTNASRASRVAWGEAFRAAVDASPVLAPVIFSIEIVVATGLILAAARRWV